MLLEEAVKKALFCYNGEQLEELDDQAWQQGGEVLCLL